MFFIYRYYFEVNLRYQLELISLSSIFIFGKTNRIRKVYIVRAAVAQEAEVWQPEDQWFDSWLPSIYMWICQWAKY